MRHAFPLTLLALLVPLAGCPGDKVNEGPSCESASTELALDEVTVLGFSAADVLVNLAPHEDAVLTWADGTVTDLSLDFAPGATARFIDLTEVPPTGSGPTPAIAIVCDDYVEIDVGLGFATADGAFAEDLATLMGATAADTAWIDEPLDLEALAGTFDLVPFVDAEDWDELSASIRVDLAAGAPTSGVISGVASGEDECAEGDECTAWATQVPVGTWGPTPE
ncbi:MAG: hypothetical protein Q8P41_04740 [Pseudomonadota bacterium]|nr:hypothetical protein [Pseudomonadota bacterium]